jgi:hypothetical protein
VITKFSWRRAVAVPAVLTLAFGGALLSTTAAKAVEGDLVVSSPVAGSTTDDRSVDVTGTATPGAAIEVFADASATTPLGTAVADATTGAFTAALTPYADDAAPEQSVFVVETVATEADETDTVDFFLPNLTVTTPAPGDELTSTTVDVSGTGIPGANVNLTPSVGDAVVGQILVGTDRTWTGQVTFSADVSTGTITVDQVLGASGRGQVVVPVTFAVVPPTTPDALDTPVITSPEQGETVTGTEVTFEGTGTPGADIGLVVAPTGSVSTLADDPADRIVVDADGNWTVTLALAPAEYTAVAVQALLDENGDPVLDGTGAPIVSAPSTPVDFTLEAAAVAPFEAPVVTSPSAGQAVVGSTLNVTGTGTPGARVAFVIYAQGGEPQSSQPFEQAQAESTIVVDAAGNWSSTVTGLVPGAYTIAPFSFALNAAGETTAVATGDPVDFTVVAAVVTAATPTTPSGLAYTGSEGTETAAGIGAAALLAGALLLIAARRRAKLAVAETPAE